MNPNGKNSGIGGIAEPNSHQEFRELCALSVRGRLPRDEQGRLERHLAGCSACSDLLKEYEGTVQQRLWGYAGAILVAVIALVSVYRLGERTGTQVYNVREQPLPNGSHVLEQQVGNLTQDGRALAAELHKRDRVIEDITNSRNRELLEVARLKEEDKNLQDAITKAGERESHLASEREAVTERLKLAQASLTKTEDDLAGLRQQREGDLIRATDLETRMAGLSQRLKDREDTIEEQQRLLAADRDIRELMGARDLYLAEVYDVGRNGDTQKPFGRIFFTKNKSLIFYAYDLDQQPGVKDTSAFQAWGQRGPDRKRTLNLGIFYQDNAANKRWVLKVDDPKTLQQIDAVFVTVEPQGGSREPSGHRLLVASLRLEPNHP